MLAKLEWIWIFSLAVFAIGAIAFGAPTRCHWNTCFVVDGVASICAADQVGTPAEMTKAETAQRKRGQLFLRECVEPNEAPSIDWPSTFQKQWARDLK